MSQKLLPFQSKIILLASLGGALEFFDFTIYAFFAPYISANFFPKEEHLIALINTFAIFVLGYCARPLGAIIFGHFGDKAGRKNSFVIAALLMAVATLLIGCLPIYQQIGISAPLLLLVLRILQGVSVGGEIPGATVFTMEHLFLFRSNFAVGIIFSGLTLGNVLGSASGYFLTKILSQQTMLMWGWRIPFVAGFFLGLVAYLLRKKATETPIFLMLHKNSSLHKFPLIKLKSASLFLLQGISLTALPAATVFTFLYLPSFPPMQLHFTSTQLYLLNIFAFISLAFFTVVFGFYADYVDKKTLLLLGTMTTTIFGYFFFTNILWQHNVYGLYLFGIGLTAMAAMVNSCYAAIIATLFPAAIRYSGMGIAYNIGFALFGGAAPLIMTTIFKATHNIFTPYFYLLFGAAITIFGILFIKLEKQVIDVSMQNN